MGVYVQLKKRKQIDVRGHPTLFQAGDWVEVGVGYARQLVADGEATIPGDKFKAIVPARSGICCLPNQHASANLTSGVYGNSLSIQAGAWESVPFQRTLFWDMAAPFRIEFIPVGFNLLSRWHIAAPLVSYDKLAVSYGDTDDRTLTAAIVHDLRVLVYDPKIVFMRRCPETVAFLRVWADERARAKCPELSFLRALYIAKPLLLALPPEWRKP